MGYGHGHGFGVGRGYSGASGEWTPASLSGIFTWVDLVQAVETTGIDIDQITDLTGQGNHLIAIATNKPDLVTLDSYLAAQEDGVDDGFRLATGTHTFSGAFTFAWAHHSTGNSCFYILSSGGTGYIRDEVGGTFGVSVVGGSGTISVAGAVSVSTWQVTVIRRDAAGAWSVRVNGVDKTAVSPLVAGGDMQSILYAPREESTSHVELNSLIIAESFATGSDLTRLEAHLAGLVGL